MEALPLSTELVVTVTVTVALKYDRNRHGVCTFLNSVPTSFKIEYHLKTVDESGVGLGTGSDGYTTELCTNK